MGELIRALLCIVLIVAILQLWPDAPYVLLYLFKDTLTLQKDLFKVKKSGVSPRRVLGKKEAYKKLPRAELRNLWTVKLWRSCFREGREVLGEV